jgi:TolB protein
VASIRLNSGIIALTAVLVTISVLAGQERIGSAREPLPPKLTVDLIAFVDTEARIQLVNPDGTEPRLLTPMSGSDQQLFAWPTWSPSGRRLVYTEVKEVPGSTPLMLLEMLDVVSGDSVVLHSAEAAGIAAGVFHYAMWSPDGERLAFIASQSGNLGLFIDTVDDEHPPGRVLENGPLWMSWSSDSQHLLAHRADSHFLLNALPEAVEVRSLGIRSTGYRVPAWQPGTSEATVLAQGQDGDFSLFSAEVTVDGLSGTEHIADVDSDATFLWSPDGERIAVGGPKAALQYLGLVVGVHSGLTVYRGGTDEKEPMQIRDAVISYFWSPDSSKIAYVSPASTNSVLRWTMFDVSDGSRWPLVDFVPTIDQLTLFQFFDQYAYSHSLWSPNSRTLVFAGLLYDEAVSASYSSGQTDEQPQIYVMDSDPSPPVQSIAEGNLGIWSPR